MLNFITLVLAIIVAQIVLLALTVLALSNERVMDAYMNWATKVSKKMTDKLFEGEEEL